MDRKRLFYYLLLPFAVAGTLVTMYFSGNETAVSLIVPRVDTIRQPRELGVLEGLQNLYLLSFTIFAVIGFRRAEVRWVKVWFGLATLFGVFMLLEESDWGVVYYDYFIHEGQSRVYRQDFLNVHNIGDTDSTFKRLNDAATVLYFVLFPFVIHTRGRPKIKYLRPHAYSAATCVMMFLLSSWTHHLGRTVEHTGMEKGFGEFRELNTYWLWVLYFWELVFVRKYEPSPEAA